MTEPRELPVAALLTRAFGRCRAPEVNAALGRVRAEVEREVGKAQSYEVVLAGPGVAPRGWSYLRDVVAPRLAYHLAGTRGRVDHCPGTFLTMFDGDHVYFLHAEDFFAHYREVEGLSAVALKARAAGWERDGGGPA